MASTVRLFRKTSSRLLRRLSTASQSPRVAIEALSKPSWSVHSLLPPKSNAVSVAGSSELSPEKLRHLLRLAALPPPVSAEEESDLMRTLLDQLHFVRDTQSVDTSGIQPLQMIRDEISVRQYSIKDVAPDTENDVGKQGSVEWDVLSLAERKLGSYLVVDEAPEVETGGVDALTAKIKIL